MWVVFLSVMLLMLPFLSRTQQLMREFSLVAGVSTVATALDLLFVAVFSLGSFASLTLALFISLAVYAAARQWLLTQLISRKRISTERMFEHVYRMAREVQLQPQSAAEQLRRLMRELFDPIEARVAARRTQRSQVLSDGTQPRRAGARAARVRRRRARLPSCSASPTAAGACSPKRMRA